MSEHPSQNHLRLFQEDRLPHAEAAAINEHIELCGPCQAVLDKLKPFDAAADAPLDASAEQPTGIENPGGRTTDDVESPSGPIAGVENDSLHYPTMPGYEILDVLGHGGMGVVYRARHVALNRIVALKMLSAWSQVRSENVSRFRAEAEAVASLKHPNIVQIFEIGEWHPESAGPPVPFFSLEFVEGGSLAARLNGTPQPPRQAARLVETLARAVQHAHEVGIIHRDLKPANVLIAEPGDTPLGESTPKITDFGLAKRVEGVGQTQSGAILGTPSYMAPEQARGEKQIGPPTDVYALGAILYEALTGRPPLKGETVLDTLDQVRTEEPVSPRRLQPKVPRDLETICLKCLEKSPEQRYANAEALADDLRRFIDGRPVVARPTSRGERIVKWAKRYPAAASLIGTLFVGVIVSSAVTWFALNQWDRAVDAEKQLHGRLIQSHLDAAKLAIQRGAWRQALDHYSRAEKDGQPPTIEFRLDKVRAWIAVNEPKEAKWGLQTLALESDLGDQSAIVDLYSGELLLGYDDKRAVELVGRALSTGKLTPADGEFAKGLLARKSLDALEHYQRAISHDAFHQRAREMAGTLLFTLGRLDDARTHLIQSEAIFPEHPGFQLLLVLIEVWQEKRDAARTRLNKVPGRDIGRGRDLFQLLVEKFDPKNDLILYPGGSKKATVFSDPKLMMQLLSQVMSLVKLRPESADSVHPNEPLPIHVPPHLRELVSSGGFLLLVGLRPEQHIDKLAQIVEVHPEGTLLFVHATSLFQKAQRLVGDRIENVEANVPHLEETRLACLRSLHTAALAPVRGPTLDILVAVELMLGSPKRAAPNLEMRRESIKHLRERISLGFAEVPSDVTRVYSLAAQAAQEWRPGKVHTIGMGKNASKRKADSVPSRYCGIQSRKFRGST